MHLDLVRALLASHVTPDGRRFELAEYGSTGKKGQTEERLVMQAHLVSDPARTLVFKLEHRSPQFLAEKPAGQAYLDSLRPRSCCDYAILLMDGSALTVLLVELVRKVRNVLHVERTKVEQLVLARPAVEYLLKVAEIFMPGKMPAVSFKYFLLHLDADLPDISNKRTFETNDPALNPRAIMKIHHTPDMPDDYYRYGLAAKPIYVMARAIVCGQELHALQLVEDYDSFVSNQG